MTLSTKARKQLKALFAQEDKWQKLHDLMDYSILNESLILKSSKRSEGFIEMHDSQLFRIIREFAKEKLGHVQAEIEEVTL